MVLDLSNSKTNTQPCLHSWIFVIYSQISKSLQIEAPIRRINVPMHTTVNISIFLRSDAEAQNFIDPPPNFVSIHIHQSASKPSVFIQNKI
ncbi:hypothetical protein DVH24_000009 [Malus domestica]|uniref:Uncharacterized protein n=1 Tax=Malus domestica TaxID=3750 RepID=A0A498IYT6_MALDO|nr:hypothetical protein DVH24_000009 [Malus domestica]